jgi:hypothetical protein
MVSRFILSLLLLAATGAALGAGDPIVTDKPIINFRLPEFTAEGNRAWLVRGSEAQYASQGQLNIKGLNLSIFTGQPDGKVETLILSPAAQVHYPDMVAQGKDSIRVVNDRFEATGTVWNYSHKEKKVSIAGNVRVVLHTELKDILK